MSPVGRCRPWGATRLAHLEDAVAAIDVSLSGDEVARLEEPYRPHPVIGL
jgi:1-deoxyxylulose-5-phosphate synthase